MPHPEKPDCPFCRIARHELSHHVVWRDAGFVAFLDKNPQRDGHTLLVPSLHVEHFTELDDALYTRLFLAAKHLGVAIQKATGARRVGLVIEGFGVAHLHIHLIPINGPGDLHPAR